MAMSLLIFFIFTIGLSLTVFLGKLGEIKNDWNNLRCDPTVMPIAGFVGPEGTDTVSNFSHCLANSQGDLMGGFMAPLQATSNLTNILGSSILDSLQSVRKMGDYSNFMSGFMMEHLLNLFMTIMIRFKIIILKIKNIMMKLVAMVYIITYMGESSAATILSVDATYIKPVRDVL